jgi:hypothetical protein
MGHLAATLREEIKAGDEALRLEIKAGDEALRLEIRDVRLEMANMQKSLLKWFVASQAATITVIATLVASLRA